MAAFTTIAAIISIASTAYSVVQAQKARKNAEQAAENRKGQELVVEGEVTSIPLVYGRSLVGGVRAWHATSGNFNYSETNADKSFMSGPAAMPGGSYLSQIYNNQTGEWAENTVTYNGVAAGNLNKNFTGSKNEFLYFQQAICVGPINAVKDVLIEDSMYIDDPKLGTYNSNSSSYTGASILSKPVKAASRIDVRYNGGADTITARNFGERETAEFTDLAYASAFFRIDRDSDRVFSGIPKLQFLVEGRKVRKIDINGVLSDRVYSNNPAWCLLDYLLDDVVGRGIPYSMIDKQSFYNSALACDKVVMPNAVVGGKIWNPTDGASSASSRVLPLYECNIIVNPSSTIRSNVEAILSTMGDARLVWSGGKYKLSLQYPSSDSDIAVAGVVTDDDIVNGDTIQMNWPGTTERLNYVTVRFHNESENFKEDAVSWPPKSNGEFFKGIGGQKYIEQSGWDEGKSGGRFMNSYAVWNSILSSTSLKYIIMPRYSGNYTLKYLGDDTMSVNINGQVFTQDSFHEDYENSTSITLAANTVYTIEISGTDTGGKKGMAAILTAPNGNQIWTTRSDAYSSYIMVENTSAVYDQYRSEDSGLQLESDIFLDGVTDYYHALAKAEETVRISRTAVQFSFKCLLKDKYYEPGDVIKLISDTLQITGDVFVKISEVKVSEGGITEVTGTRFDAAQLAWNVDDSDPGTIGDIGNYQLTPPSNFYYAPPVNATEINGTLNWNNTADTRVDGYILYFHESNNLDSDGRPIFNEIGRADRSPFILTGLANTSGIFGIRSYSSDGRLSVLITTGDSEAIQVENGPLPPVPTNLDLSRFISDIKQLSLSFTIPVYRADGSVYDNHWYSKIYQSTVNNSASAVVTDVTYANTKSLRVTGSGTFYFWVRLVSRTGREGGFSNPVSIIVEPTISELLELLQGQIKEDQLFSDLASRIDLIDGPKTLPGSVAAQLDTFKTQITDLLDGIDGSAITDLQQQDADFAVTINGMLTRLGTSESSITNLNSTVAGQATSLTNLLTTVNGHTSSITNLNNTTGTQAQSIGQLSTTVGSHTTTLQTQATSISGVQGSYTVKIDNNGYVTGFGLASSSNTNGNPTGRFFIRADSFAIGNGSSPVDTANLVATSIPFIVRTTATVVNGITIPPGVYMKSAFVETVTADRVDTRGLVIKDAVGNVILGAGTPLSSSYLASGSGGNLIPNSAFNTGSTNWGIGYNPSGSNNYTIARDLAGADQTPEGSHQIGVVRPGSVGAAASTIDILYYSYISVIPGSKYEYSAYLASHRCQGYLCIAWYKLVNNAYTYIGEVDLPSTHNGNGGRRLDNWERVGAIITAPSDATMCRIYLRAGAVQSGQIDPYAWFTNIFLAKANSSQTELSNWSDGAAAGVLSGLNSVSIGNNVTFPDGSVVNSNDLVSRLSHINSGNIGTFIDGAAITNAYIGNAAVGTLTIQGNAVTVPSYAEANGQAYVYITLDQPGYVLVSAQAASICSFQGNAPIITGYNGYIQCSNGATSGYIDTSINASAQAIVTHTGSFYLGAGSYWFAPVVQPQNNSRTMSRSNIWAIGAKR